MKLEKEAGRVFTGWKEGKIYFAPTYKYSHNSDAYAGETVKSKKKRRTPAWYVMPLICLFTSQVILMSTRKRLAFREKKGGGNILMIFIMLI